MSLETTQIEAVSNLIKACKAIGATYHEDKIVLADGNVIPLRKLEFQYFTHSGTPAELKIRLLEIHIKILQEKA